MRGNLGRANMDCTRSDTAEDGIGVRGCPVLTGRSKSGVPFCEGPLSHITMLAQNQDGSRRLNCLIEGESNVLQVNIVAIDKAVSELQDDIRSKAAHALQNIGAHKLVLYKDGSLRKVIGVLQANIDLRTNDVSSITVGDAEQLEPWQSILHYWPNPPPKYHLHIIARAPVMFMSMHSAALTTSCSLNIFVSEYQPPCGPAATLAG